jgi:autotransporter-associated beta strand protein
MPYWAGRRGRQVLFLLRLLLLGLLASVPSLFATDAVWTGGTDTDWSRKQNWSTNNVPTSTDNAKFSGAITNQPSTTAAVSVGGIWMATGVTQNITIGGTFTLTLAGNTINGTAGLGILVNNTSAWTLTINAPLALGATQTWTNNSGNLLTVGAVNLSTFGLTVNGTGNTSDTGVVSGSGTFTKSGTGTVTFTGTNTYTGSTTVSAGILNIQNASALGTTAGGTTVSSGATLQLQNGISVGAESLTISGSGAAGQNGALVNVSSTNNYAGLVTLGAAATISSDSGTLNLTNTGTISGSGFGLTLTGTGNGSIASVIGTGAGTLTKSGSGTWTLTGTNTFSGSTTINAGTLTAAAASGNALGSTTSITVNSGGTLLLGASNQINNTAGVTLAGGTFSVGGFVEGDSSHAGMGALTLTANSHIDFGTGAAGLLNFSSFVGNLHTLTIDNWTGTVGLGGSSSTDRLIFDSDQTSNLGLFSFTGYVGATEIALGGGFYEVVPVFTPEPSTYFVSILAVTGLGWYRRRLLQTLLSRARTSKISSLVRVVAVSFFSRPGKSLQGYRAIRNETSIPDSGIEIFAHR